MRSKFAYVLKRRREAAGLSQIQLATAADVSNKRISAFEKGTRIPTNDEHSRLSSGLGWLPPAVAYTAPTYNEEWRSLFRDRRDWQPEPERSLASRLKTAREAYPELMRGLESTVKKHEQWLNSVNLGSSLELVVCLILLQAGLAVELSVRLLSWGFRQRPVIDPKTGEARGDYPFLALGVGLSRGKAVLVPQVGVLADGPMAVDLLVGLSNGRRRFWFVVEIDGGAHLTAADRARDQRHGMEVIHITESEILSSGFTQMLIQRLEERLGRLLAA